MSDELFNPADVKPVHQIDPTKDYTGDLVGEGKKYAAVSDLARSRLEAENHVAKLEQETKGLRAELDKRLTFEELLTKLSTPAKESVPQGELSPVQREDSQGTVKPQTPEDIQRLVDQRISAKVQEGVQKTNLDFAKSKLREKFGENFTEVLDKATKELGVSPEYLNSLAKTAPNVLLKLVSGEQENKPDVSALPQGRQVDASKQVLSGARTNDGFRGQKFYLDLVKSDPKTFWSAKTQNEMHQMAMKDPERYQSS